MKNNSDKENGKNKQEAIRQGASSEALVEPKTITVLAPAPATEELVLAPVMDIALAKKRLAEFQEFVRDYLVEDEDFGTIPNTQKPTLYKPGADKLCELYGLADSYRILTEVEDFFSTPALFHYKIECCLYRGSRLVSTGLGSCNSYEDRYRWREAQRVCPVCKKDSIVRESEKYAKDKQHLGWVCWKKKDGCGAFFKEGDTVIEGQQVGKVPNENIATLANTILKMAKKRCKVDATLAATRSSGLFTQDLEDNAPSQPEPPPIQPPQRKRQQQVQNEQVQDAQKEREEHILDAMGDELPNNKQVAAPPPPPSNTQGHQFWTKGANGPIKITSKQQKMMFAKARAAGRNDEQIRGVLRQHNIEHSDEVPVSLLGTILKELGVPEKDREGIQ